MSPFEDLASYLSLRTQPEDTATLTVPRGGRERTVEVTLSARPEQSWSPFQ